MEKSAMFLKILSFTLLISGALSSIYDYKTLNGNDMTLTGPLELSLLRTEDEVASYSRAKRSLTSTELPYANEGAEGGSNSSPPHVLASPAGSTGSSATSSVLSSLSTNPTLADKGKLPTATVGVGAPPSGKYSKTSGKKVPSSSDEKVKVPLPQNGVAGMLNTPISNGHGGGGSNTPIVNLDGQPNAQSNNNTVYSTSAPVSSHMAPPAGSSDAGMETFGDFPSPEEDISNKTLANHHITTTTNDSHTYYNSSVSREESRAKSLWVELTDANSKKQDSLSNAHRRAVTQKLSFDFPFYGHVVHNVTITTGGFLYTGEQTHPWLAATQFIAPLMANFDTSLTHDSVIRYLENDTQLTVQWENVRLQDKPDAGGFTFQASLYKSGNIAFVYKSIPVVAIDDDHHPVKVGLSDSYVMDKTIFFVRRKTIYEYHRVQFSHTDISNWTSIYLTALPTCLDHKDCEACTSDLTPQFTCLWCPTANRCSTGLDRNRQDWVQKGCDRSMITASSQCAAAANHASHVQTADSVKAALDPKSVHTMGASSLFLTLICLASIVGMVVWALYAYNNPMSSSGQILIRYRPSQWTMKRGEARYTAATIHM